MNEERKIERKRKRFSARMKKSKGIIFSNSPSHNIILCNVGQATGLNKENIHDFLLKSSLGIVLPKFIAEKGETYSFLTFNNTDEAQLFYNTYNGRGRLEGCDIPIYMAYVENVPNTEIICEISVPTGLIILNDFISSEEEELLLKIFNFSDNVESNLRNREVKHYGYEFRYGTNDVDLLSPLMDKIPEECNILWRRLRKEGFDFGEPDQLTVNKYSPGQGIPSHVDKHSPFGETILSLSLGSTIVMDWKHHSGKYVPVVVTARSMLIMREEARYDWQHGIQSRTHDPVIETRFNRLNNQQYKVITSDTVPRQTRISLTFRWTRAGPCRCGYSVLCDSVEKTNELIEDNLASDLEEMHVHQVYEQIASHFSSTRHRAWPRVVEFVRAAPPGAILLDLGCGNGKNMLPRDDILQIAGERSAGLLRECSATLRAAGVARAQCVRLDMLCAPLRDHCADVVICVAVIHHFSSQSRRLQAIKTICRVLRRGGKALITVWAKDQKTSNYICKNKLSETTQQVVSVNGITLPVHENRTQFKHSDLLVPWKLKNNSDNKLNMPDSTLLRYYHVFEEGELMDLCEQVSDLVVENHFFEEGNWCVICKKA